jgi:hypothetical protein
MFCAILAQKLCGLFAFLCVLSFELVKMFLFRNHVFCLRWNCASLKLGCLVARLG